MNSLPPEARSKTISYWERMGKLNLLSGLQAIASQKRTTLENHKNQEAESEFVRRTVWGASENPNQGEDMGDHTILGDIHYPPPIAMQGNQSSLGSLATIAVAGLLGGGGLAAGLAAPYLLDRMTPDEQPTPVVQPGTDETVSVGFGKVEGGIAEYLKANP